MTGQDQSEKLSAQRMLQLARFRAMAEAHLERLGSAIQRRREERRWSRNDLGRRVSAHEKTVERWEKAQTGGACDNLESIAAAFECTVDELLEDAKADPTPDLMESLLGQVADLHEQLGLLCRTSSSSRDPREI